MSKIGFPTEEASSQVTDLEQRIADQATIIDSLKRALAASERDLEAVLKTIRIVQSRDREEPRRHDLTAKDLTVG